MEKYALLGWPVKHSVSPQMQGAGFRALGMAATYELLEVPPEGLAACVERLTAEGYAGWNATVPHKEQMARLVHELDPGAAAAGCVNTVVNAGGRLRGYSTDGVGLARALQESFGLALPGLRCVFLGTGGAARATAVYFATAGAAEIVLVNRTLSTAEALAGTIATAAPGSRLRCLPLADTAAVGRALEGMDCLIQSTSLGLHPGDPLPIAPAVLPPALAVLDMVYGNTPFLQGARARGCRTADGRGMLLYQGVRSFELWTGRQAPVEAMRAALERALAARG
jgi:shikimate dehydrogenase